MKQYKIIDGRVIKVYVYNVNNLGYGLRLGYNITDKKLFNSFIQYKGILCLAINLQSYSIYLRL